MNPIVRLALAVATAALGVDASAHASLIDSFPASGAVIPGPPAMIHLTFSERVQARSCRIKLVNAAGKNFDADRAAADKGNPNLLVASVPVLKPGVYNATWTAVGHDGHRVNGNFSFTVSR